MGQKKKNKKSKKISGLFLRVFVLVFVVAVAVGIGRQAARYQEVKDETALSQYAQKGRAYISQQK